MVTARLGVGEIAYVERRGEWYHWVRLAAGAATPLRVSPFPDAWIYWAGAFPAGDLNHARDFFDALLADMEHQPTPRHE